LDLRVIKEQIKNNNLSDIDSTIQQIKKATAKKSFITSIIMIAVASLCLIFYNSNFNEHYFNQQNFTIFAFVSLFIFIAIALFELISSIYYIYKDRANMKTLKREMFINQIVDILSFLANSVGIIFYIFIFVITPASVSGDSMNDSYFDGDRILIYHLTNNINDGDVIVAYTEHFQLNGELIVKRVVAKSGDKLLLKDNALYVNGELVQDHLSNYQMNKLAMDEFGDSYAKIDEEFEIPEGYYIVMGDNRNHSSDSRSIGMVKEEDIMGKAIIRIYPFDSIGLANKIKNINN